MASERGTRLLVMRNFASGRSHLVNLADEHLSWFQWIGPEFLGTQTPYITICGATIRPGRHAAVWMQNGDVCTLCQRFAPSDSIVAFYEPVDSPPTQTDAPPFHETGETE